MSKPSLRKWEEITDILTEKGIRELKAGMVLIFDYEGSPVNLKIMRKKQGRVWAKKIDLHNPDDVEVVEAA